jgi:hypothetical protein
VVQVAQAVAVATVEMIPPVRAALVVAAAVVVQAFQAVVSG